MSRGEYFTIGITNLCNLYSISQLSRKITYYTSILLLKFHFTPQLPIDFTINYLPPYIIAQGYGTKFWTKKYLHNSK